MDNQMTNEAPTKDEVARAFRHLRHKCSDGSGGYTAINILRAHIAALKVKYHNAVMDLCEVKEVSEPLNDKVTALEAENKRLREALEELARLGGSNGEYGNSIGNQIAKAALAQTGEK